MLRQAVREQDPTLPLFDIAAMPDVVSRSVGPRSVASGILSAFAFIALFLSLLGIYGVLAYSTGERTKEIGIRLALGAEPRETMRMVVKSGGTLTVVGLATGLGGFLAFARVLSGVTYGVSPRDLATIVVASVVLMTCINTH
ncbi:MAG: FtsX-like permease family protein [bacterium]